MTPRNLTLSQRLEFWRILCESFSRLFSRRAAPTPSFFAFITGRLPFGQADKVFFSLAFNPSCSIIFNHEEIRRVHNSEGFAAFRSVVQFDGGLSLLKTLSTL